MIKRWLTRVVSWLLAPWNIPKSRWGSSQDLKRAQVIMKMPLMS
jgi:hypothetical protein